MLPTGVYAAVLCVCCQQVCMLPFCVYAANRCVCSNSGSMLSFSVYAVVLCVCCRSVCMQPFCLDAAVMSVCCHSVCLLLFCVYAANRCAAYTVHATPGHGHTYRLWQGGHGRLLLVCPHAYFARTQVWCRLTHVNSSPCWLSSRSVLMQCFPFVDQKKGQTPACLPVLKYVSTLCSCSTSSKSILYNRTRSGQWRTCSAGRFSRPRPTKRWGRIKKEEKNGSNIFPSEHGTGLISMQACYLSQALGEICIMFRWVQRGVLLFPTTLHTHLSHTSEGSLGSAADCVPCMQSFSTQNRNGNQHIGMEISWHLPPRVLEYSVIIGLKLDQQQSQRGCSQNGCAL